MTRSSQGHIDRPALADDFHRVARLVKPLRFVVDGWERQASQIAAALRPHSETQRQVARLRSIVDGWERQASQIASALRPHSEAQRRAAATLRSIAERQRQAVQFTETLSTSRELLNHLDRSMIGLARLSRLSDSVRTISPRSAWVAELAADKLGGGVETQPDDNASKRVSTAQHDDLSSALTALPLSSHGEVALAAVFNLNFTPMAAPQAVESGHSGAAFHPSHWQVLVELEQRLRCIVEETLSEIIGPNLD